MIGNRGWIKTEFELRNAVEKNDDLSNKGAYLNLMSQLNKIARHKRS